MGGLIAIDPDRGAGHESDTEARHKTSTQSHPLRVTGSPPANRKEP
jgi:hypothetical protein